MKKDNIISRQLRAARILLDWTQEELANNCKLSIETISKLEKGFVSRTKTMQLVQRAFEDAGLEFIEPGGVRHRLEDVTIYRGHDGIVDFYDDVYQTSKKKGRDIVSVCHSETALLPPIESEIITHIERMTRLRDKLSVKCILTQEPDQLRGKPYSEYRFISKHHVNSIPFFVYGDKYAIAFFEKELNCKIIVIQSGIAAQAFRQQFQSMWEKATLLTK